MKNGIRSIIAALAPVVLLAACGGSEVTVDTGASTAVPHVDLVLSENSTLKVFEFVGEGESLEFSLGGADAAHFSIDTQGVVSPLLALDFEAPVDQNSDNSYEVEIYRGEAELPVQRLSVQVTDQLILGSPTLHIEAGTKQLTLGVVIDDPLSSVHQLRINHSPGGGSGFSPMDSNRDGAVDVADMMPSSTTSLVLPNHGFDLAFNTRLYLVEALSESGEVLATSASIGPSGLDATDVIQYVKASNTGANDLFGYTIALSGDGSVLAVGAKGENGSGVILSDGSAGEGAVYVYRHDGSGWQGPVYLKASNNGANDDFGYDIALSDDGNTLAVGAWAEDGSGTGVAAATDEAAENAGAVYVYRYDGTVWQSPVYIKASNTGALDFFGSWVALSGDGNILAVAASGEDGSGTGVNPVSNNDAFDEAGAVYIYQHDGSGWQSTAYIKASNTSAGDNFGRGVALSDDGKTLAVGAHYEDGSGTGVGAASDESASNAGAVYVYRHDGSGWQNPVYIKASNTGTGDFFGESVKLSGDGRTLAVSASGEDGSGTGVDPVSNNSANQSGAAYVYRHDGVGWQSPVYFKASNTGAIDWFAFTIALSNDGNTLAVGASTEDGGGVGVNAVSDEGSTDSGAVYVYRHDGNAWQSPAYIKADNTGAGDWFGISVALSGDGSTLAVGAHFEDGSGTGVDAISDDGANHAGAVYLY